jgi:hypothetical protein
MLNDLDAGLQKAVNKNENSAHGFNMRISHHARETHEISGTNPHKK